MPRLSLYRPEKGKDYTFLDKTITEMFTVGGTDVFVHKYLGPKNPAEGEATAGTPTYDAVKETNIQDLVFLENRDNFSETDWKNLYKISEDTFVEETDSLKKGAAGAGLTDND